MDGNAEHGARCAEHPESPASGTCTRCGSYMCTDCRATTILEHCERCASKLEQGRFVAQVPVFAILLAAHGVLLAGMGAYFLIYTALFLLHGVSANDAIPTGEADGFISGMLFGAFGFIGAATLIVGILQLVAGLRLRTFRSRLLGFVALAAGLLTVISCYCAPSSIALLIWGAIVLRSPDVAARFDAASSSRT